MRHDSSSTTRRRLAALLAVLAALVPVGIAQAQDQLPEPRAQDNYAISQVQTDGAHDFDFAWSVYRQRGDVVDSQNLAYATTHCANCRAVAIAFQIVLAVGTPHKVVPENVALAVNDHSDSSMAYADARQFVRIYTRPVRIRAAGRKELADVRRDIRDLEARNLDAFQLDAALDAERTRVLEVLNEQIVAVGGGKAEEVDRESPQKHDDA